MAWAHFDSQCGYCGERLERSSRKGHLDHLIPSSQGGTNHISNRMPSCPACNGDEKKDLPWEPFLQSKCATDEILKERRTRIRSWQSKFSSVSIQLPPDVHVQLEAAISLAVAAYDNAAMEVTALKRKMKQDKMQPPSA
ncbi:HNH endonuclease signature motif containing protein [Myxococcus fulvus]|uniref:HNH endonuclease signature motif containing protein n=1 Tax=Myxococcus fulvus TaxID=33 RepID=UPI003B9CBA68